APRQAGCLKSGIYVGASARLTGKEVRRKHVVFESKVVLQVSGLQEYAGMLRPESGLLALRLAGHPLTADSHPAAIRVIEPGEAIDKGRLAASGWAGERHCLACGDRERNPAQRERFVVAYVVETIEIVGLERLRHPTHVKLREICRQTSTLSDPAGAESERTASFPFLKYSYRSVSRRTFFPVTESGAEFSRYRTRTADPEGRLTASTLTFSNASTEAASVGISSAVTLSIVGRVDPFETSTAIRCSLSEKVTFGPDSVRAQPSGVSNV